jgi:hypothetical protein
MARIFMPGLPVGRPDGAGKDRDRLMVIAANNRQHRTAFIENRKVFGDLCDDPRFVRA